MRLTLQEARSHGNSTQKKFIAQQVELLFPIAQVAFVIGKEERKQVDTFASQLLALEVVGQLIEQEVVEAQVQPQGG